MEIIKLENDTNKMNFLSTTEVAERLGCSTKTARKLFKQKDFPSVRIGKNYRVLESEFVLWCKGKIK